MKLNAVLTASALCTLAISPAHAEPQRSVDVRSFDVAGVKTGMDYKEALAAVASHFQVPASSLRQGSPTFNLVTQTKLSDVFTYEKDGVRLQVSFEGRVPVDKTRPLAVSLVNYEIPWTPNNRDQMTQAVLQKYGKQSNYPNNVGLEWCEKPNANPGMGCPSDQAKLSYSNVSIQLSDPAWTFARIKYVEQSKSTKPSF